MQISINGILKFLFPEWQVIKAIKEQGFISLPNKNKQKNQYQFQNTTQQHSGNYICSNNGISNTIQSGHKSLLGKSTPEHQGNSAAYQYQNTSKVDPNNVADIFNSIRFELGNLMIGQSTYLDNLCIAFKRPFVTGYDKVKPKNVVFIHGNKGTGKHSSVSFTANLLKEKKLISSNEILSIDLSLYETVSELDLFLSDLYKCLFGQSDIIIIDNFDKCHTGVIDVISTLTVTGKYTLDARYIVQNNNLVETTGMLVQNSISEISSNGKYFVFITEKSEKDVLNSFGTKFMDCIGDIISTADFTDRDLQNIALRVIENVKRKSNQNLSINLNWDRSISLLLAENYNTLRGVNSINEYAEAYIYKPLAEYKLKSTTNSNQSVILSLIDGVVTAQAGNERIQLAEFMPKKHNSRIEDVKRELDEVIGLESVKQYVLALEENLKIQKIRENAGRKSANISMHMIFTGNPGTGKTTIARIVAKYLKALGVLSAGQLREVTRADLVGQYVGHTAKLTNDVIKSALGGVLFIDEAYALCRDKYDTFGLEAIDTLVKGIEDNRDDLVVILAGYQNEIDEFLKANSGLKSRFPNIIDFEDYTPDEMYRISLITAKTKGYKIAEDCKDPLMKLFDKSQIKGRNDSGNGRLVRNFIESAILKQSKRLLTGDVQEQEMDLLIYNDFNFEEAGNFDLELSLSQIVGLENVKEFVRMQSKLLIAQEKRKKAGMQVDTTQTLNMIFRGNPGTGKTTIARVMAKMFKEMGLLKSGHLIETDRGGLVAEYVGQTAKKTEEVFRSALGGVLFIDEAYSLSSDGGSFGKESIDTLVKLIEDFRGEIVVILAGYQKEMSDFLKTNSGLESRFPLKIDFPDYTAEELFEITLKMIASKGFVLADGVASTLKEKVVLLHKQSNVFSGNGRMVRNYLEEILRNQSARIATNDVPVEKMNLIILADIEHERQLNESFEIEKELSKIIGLNEVKDYIRSLNARLRMQKERKKLGLPTDDAQTLHMIFKGNPGTGKTMVARTVAQVLYHIGVITTDKLIETDRSGLVAGYVGQTAIKTRDKVMEALDGVLFIDEAYSLSQGGPNDFGKEAIDTIVKLMDDYRDRIVVILAGYSKDMDDFLSVNPGLKSRFPNVIEFADYSTEELMQISEMFFHGKGYELEIKAKNKLGEILDIAKLDSRFGNGRYVRNLFEKAVNNQAMRLSTDTDLTKEELINITDSDIERV